MDVKGKRLIVLEMTGETEFNIGTFGEFPMEEVVEILFSAYMAVAQNYLADNGLDKEEGGTVH